MNSSRIDSILSQNSTIFCCIPKKPKITQHTLTQLKDLLQEEASDCNLTNFKLILEKIPAQRAQFIQLFTDAEMANMLFEEIELKDVIQFFNDALPTERVRAVTEALSDINQTTALNYVSFDELNTTWLDMLMGKDGASDKFVTFIKELQKEKLIEITSSSLVVKFGEYYGSSYSPLNEPENAVQFLDQRCSIQDEDITDAFMKAWCPQARVSLHSVNLEE